MVRAATAKPGGVKDYHEREIKAQGCKRITDFFAPAKRASPEPDPIEDYSDGETAVVDKCMVQLTGKKPRQTEADVVNVLLQATSDPLPIGSVWQNDVIFV